MGSSKLDWRTVLATLIEKFNEVTEQKRPETSRMRRATIAFSSSSYAPEKGDVPFIDLLRLCTFEYHSNAAILFRERYPDLFSNYKVKWGSASLSVNLITRDNYTVVTERTCNLIDTQTDKLVCTIPLTFEVQSGPRRWVGELAFPRKPEFYSPFPEDHYLIERALANPVGDRESGTSF